MNCFKCGRFTGRIDGLKRPICDGCFLYPKKKKEHLLFKNCNLPCEFQHEGLCAVASITKGKVWPEDCTAKTVKDLVEVED